MEQEIGARPHGRQTGWIGEASTMNNNEPDMWGLVTEISQSLQISFASIKAAISSLLGGDIFWDQATQHEFMQTIDHSVDELSELTAVMTTAMRIKNGTLTLQRDPHSLQEILSLAKDDAQKLIPKTPITLALPAEMCLAVVDFENLQLALRLLLEVLLSTRERTAAPLAVQLLPEDSGWQITFAGGFSSLTRNIVNWFCYQTPEHALYSASLRPEIKLKALTSYRLLSLHAIRIAIESTNDEAGALALYIPARADA